MKGSRWYRRQEPSTGGRRRQRGRHTEDVKRDQNEFYESDALEKSTQVAPRALLSNPFTQRGKYFRKTVNRKEGQPYFKPLGGKVLSDTNYTITLNNCQVLRKSDLAFKKNNPMAPNKFTSKTNILVKQTELETLENLWILPLRRNKKCCSVNKLPSFSIKNHDRL